MKMYSCEVEVDVETKLVKFVVCVFLVFLSDFWWYSSRRSNWRSNWRSQFMTCFWIWQ